jgi:hypothetical protein
VITCGVKHIRYWTLLGNTLQFKEGEFGKCDTQTLLCIGTFGRVESTDENNNSCFTGAINGDIIVWKKNKIDRIISGAHNVNKLILLYEKIVCYFSLDNYLFY